MIIDKPAAVHIPQLRCLWKQAFGDTDAFLDGFFATGFSRSRCRCLTLQGKVAAALYWFDCTWQKKRLAYLYAVATDAACRGQGLCRALMENTHAYLQNAGYDGAILVPVSPELFRLYEKLGYRTCCHVTEFSCAASDVPVSLRPIDPQEYAALRRRYLPENSVLQEAETLAFLQTFAQFYAGKGFVLAGTLEKGIFVCTELLGAPETAPGILAALGAAQGRFRTPGTQKPFAMYHSLAPDAGMPHYFGLALD